MNLKYVSPAPSFIKGIVKDYREGYSPIILICGKPRVSKTTKGFIFANWISGLLFRRSWDWEKNTIISVDQLIQEMNISDEGRIYVMDEVQRQLAKKMWMRPESQLFSLIMGSQAYKHFILFLILPKAWDLGSDHATSVNYVCPIHSRTFCYPYHVETNIWDISLKKKLPKKFPLSYFYLDIKDKKTFGAAFEKELTRLDEYKSFINKNLKEVIMTEALENINKRKTGYDPRKPMNLKNCPDWVKEAL